MVNVIGKKYYPTDNSYAVCLSDGRTDYMLGGNYVGKEKDECVIVSEPFLMQIRKAFGNYEAKKMVLVKCPQGLIHSVLFSERGFENKVMNPSPFAISIATAYTW